MKQIFLFSDSFSLLGTIYGVVGSLMLSLYSIYTKKVLPSVNQQVWLLSYYNNAYSILLFLPLIVLNGELTALWNYPNFDSTYFWFQMLVGGLCGFAIGYVTSLQIQVILLIWYFNFRILLFKLALFMVYYLCCKMKITTLLSGDITFNSQYIRHSQSMCPDCDSHPVVQWIKEYPLVDIQSNSFGE